MTRAVAWGLAAAALALAGGVTALILTPLAPAPTGPEPGRSLYQAQCASCHGPDGRGGSWRARLLLLHPGNLASPQVAALPDRYLADIIRHGGATLGKPGMPAFGFLLGEAEIQALVTYLRVLPSLAPGPRAAARRAVRYNAPRFMRPASVLASLALGALPLSAGSADAEALLPPLRAEPAPEIRGLTPREIDDLREGRGLVLAEEAGLEAAFRAGAVDEHDVTARLGRLASLQAELRGIHLRAHLRTRALLSEPQVARYRELRRDATGPPAVGPPAPGTPAPAGPAPAGPGTEGP